MLARRRVVLIDEGLQLREWARKAVILLRILRTRLDDADLVQCSRTSQPTCGSPRCGLRHA